MAVYPPSDVERQLQVPEGCCAAPISKVIPETPADDAGFYPGCVITAVDGQPVRDIIDWRWLASDYEMELDYIDGDGDAGTVYLEREPGEDWGFEFEGVVFDKVKICRNNCTFCFMRQLPPNVRPSLSMRDDDFRLSFLAGTFVTLTNLTPEDEARIIEQRISPLRVSLHASDPQVRRFMIGKHAQHGIDALDRLLDSGIEVHAQIVLVPDQNDGKVLEDTLTWAYERPGIVNIGIVPLGYTKFQDRFTLSFNEPYQAREVLDVVALFQKRALAERNHPWVFAADEFYNNAYGSELLSHLPSTEFYGDFSMFEDGIGIIRSFVDDWNEALEAGVMDHAAQTLRQANVKAYYLVGYAMQPFLDQLIAESCLAGCFEALTVENSWFGGNVDVTGLLCGGDIASAIRSVVTEHAASTKGERLIFAIPEVVLNDHACFLDDLRVDDVEKLSGVPVSVVSCNAANFLTEVAASVSSELH